MRNYTLALLEEIKYLKKNANAREGRDASIAEASGGSGGSASVREPATIA